MTKDYWLVKSEPDVFSFEDLKKRPNQTTSWDGVRNYQARNFIRDIMRKGDEVLFYHSSCEVPAVVGLAVVTSLPYPDPTAWDPQSDYFDPKSDKKSPRWYAIDVTFKKGFKKSVPLADIKKVSALKNMRLVQKGQRLSIQPITLDEYRIISHMGGIQ